MNDREVLSGPRLRLRASRCTWVSQPAGPALPAHVGVALAGVALGLLPLAVTAQTRSELITTTLPYPTYQPVRDDHYGTTIGPLRIRYDLSFAVTYTDNRNYGSGAGQEDFGLRPMLNFGLFYPITDFQVLQLDFGLGYEWWANADSGNRYVLSIAPNSHLNYIVRVGDVDLRFANDTGSTTEASSRPEFYGGANPSNFEFRQLQNTTSVNATLSATRRLKITSGYSFGLVRSLNDQFTSLDRDNHSFNALAMARVTAPISAGLSGTYSIYSFPEGVQNDGQLLTFGPRVEWRLSDTIRATLFGGYTWATFDDNGTIDDRSDVSSPTFSGSLTHRINSRMTHDASVGRSFDTGFGSNYTDSFYVRYGLQAEIGPKLNPALGFSWQQASQSGASGDTGDLFSVNLGVGYPVLTRLTTGLYYSFITRTGDTAERSYTENRITFRASYRF